MKIIDKFPVSIGKICFMSALADILRFYGYGLRESELFGLCEGNLFYFGGLKGRTQEELEETNLIRELKMGGMKYEIMQMVRVLQNVLGLNVEGFVVNEKIDVKEIIKHYTDRNIPLIALVLRYYLDYSVGYQKDNFSHTVSVYGYDFEQDHVYVTDTFVATKPVSNYKGHMSMTNFEKALDLSRAVFEMVTKERLLAIYPKKVCTFDTIPISELNQSLINIAHNNLQGKMLQDDVYSGIHALRKFISEFCEWQESYQPVLFRQLLRTLHDVITNYGGPFVTNELLSEYISTIYIRENRLIYRDLAEMLSEIRRLWLIVGNMCFKASLGRLDDVCERIVERLNILLMKEEALYTKIIDQRSELGV